MSATQVLKKLGEELDLRKLLQAARPDPLEVDPSPLLSTVDAGLSKTFEEATKSTWLFGCKPTRQLPPSL
eukprot:3972872-Alexandrium_andersonii.AAC.1